MKWSREHVRCWTVSPPCPISAKEKPQNEWLNLCIMGRNRDNEWMAWKTKCPVCVYVFRKIWNDEFLLLLMLYRVHDAKAMWANCTTLTKSSFRYVWYLFYLILFFVGSYRHNLCKSLRRIINNLIDSVSHLSSYFESDFNVDLNPLSSEEIQMLHSPSIIENSDYTFTLTLCSRYRSRTIHVREDSVQGTKIGLTERAVPVALLMIHSSFSLVVATIWRNSNQKRFVLIDGLAS